MLRQGAKRSHSLSYGEYLQRRISAKDQVEMTDLFFMRYLIIEMLVGTNNAFVKDPTKLHGVFHGVARSFLGFATTHPSIVVVLLT